MLVDISQAVGGYLHDVFLGNTDWGILIGYIAQILFAMRFVVQWIASERAGHSVIPLAFWIFSIGGGILLFVYALYRRDAVFIAGQGFGISPQFFAGFRVRTKEHNARGRSKPEAIRLTETPFGA